MQVTLYETYNHLLFCTDETFAPDGAAVAELMDALDALGSLPKQGERWAVKLAAGKTERGSFIDPFTKEKRVFESRPTWVAKGRSAIKSFAELSRCLGPAASFNVGISGRGPTLRPPLKLEFDGPYDFTVTCGVRGVPCGVSSRHTDDGENRHFDDPSSPRAKEAVFTDPYTDRSVRVACSGRSRFWLQFTPGDSVFPVIRKGNLKVLDPQVIELLESRFDRPFAQGCVLY
jgi:hypothetical protein